MGDGFITRRGLGTGSSTPPDLSNYYTKSEINSLLANKVSSATLDSYYTKSTVDSKLSGKMDTIDYRIGSWTPQFYWWNTNGEAGHRNGNPYYDQGGDYVRIGRMCYINFVVQGYLGSMGGDYVGIGNLPFNSWGNSAITLRAFVRLNGQNGSVSWSPDSTPTSRPVGLTINNRNYMKILFESSGYIRDTWNAPGTFYVQGSGIYIANGNLSSSGDGDTPMEGEFNDIIHEPLSADSGAGE